jgi:hypothetical protein
LTDHRLWGTLGDEYRREPWVKAPAAPVTRPEVLVMLKSLLLLTGLCALLLLVGIGIYFVGQQAPVPTGLIHPLPESGGDPTSAAAPPTTSFASAKGDRDLADLLRRIETLERAGVGAPDTPGADRRLTAIESRLDRLEQELRRLRPASTTFDDRTTDADVSRQLRQLGRRVSELERVDPAMPTEDTIRSLSRSVDSLRSDLRALRNRVREIEYDR